MKSSLQFKILVASVLLNVFLVFYIGVEKNWFPSFISQNQTPNEIKSTNQIELESAEELYFLKAFLEKWFNFNSEDFNSRLDEIYFWTDSEHLKTPLNEKKRLMAKVQNQKISQSAQLLFIERTQNQNYQALLKIQLKENDKNLQFQIQTQIKIEKTSRSAQNLWGLKVKEFVIKTEPSIKTPKEFYLDEKRHAQIDLPCLVRSITNPLQENLQLKLTNSEKSNAEIWLQTAVREEFNLSFYCEHEQFDFKFKPAAIAALVYLFSEKEFSKPLLKSSPQKSKKPNEYLNTLRNELGFEIEQGTNQSH